MAKERILVVDDEEDILELIRFNLLKEGYQVITAASGEVALVKAREEQPDLILLDLMLPGLDGLDIYRELRKRADTNQIPIVMVTAKTEDTDIITGLELGSDDYITKPFSPRVLVARVRAVLRRTKYDEADDTRILKIHDLVIDSARHEVLVNGESKVLSASEFKITAGLLSLLGSRSNLVHPGGRGGYIPLLRSQHCHRLKYVIPRFPAKDLIQARKLNPSPA